MATGRFRFKELEAYRVALRFHGWALAVAERIPRSRWRTADQFVRASMSMVLNTAEASGRWAPGDKRQYFAVARGSTFEAAAMLDVLLASGVITREEFEMREEELAEVGARLTRLCQRWEARRGRKRRAPEG